MAQHLIVTAGLPGSGKTSVAEALGRALGWPVLSVDPIEAAMRRAGLPPDATGLAAYAVAEAAAGANLRLGRSVVVDAVNPVEAAREAWRRLAGRQGAALTFIECACSDPGVHRARVEGRVRGLDGLPEVTWARVEARRAEYEPWTAADDRLALDTTRASLGEMVAAVLAHLATAGAPEELAGEPREARDDEEP